MKVSFYSIVPYIESEINFEQYTRLSRPQLDSLLIVAEKALENPIITKSAHRSTATINSLMELLSTTEQLFVYKSFQFALWKGL